MADGVSGGGNVREGIGWWGVAGEEVEEVMVWARTFFLFRLEGDYCSVVLNRRGGVGDLLLVEGLVLCGECEGIPHTHTHFQAPFPFLPVPFLLLPDFTSCIRTAFFAILIRGQNSFIIHHTSYIMRPS